jgi:hypothetical protein
MDAGSLISLGVFLASVYLVFFKWIPKIDAEKEAAKLSAKVSVEQLIDANRERSDRKKL